MQLNGITAVAISLGCIISTVMYFIKKYEVLTLKDEIEDLNTKLIEAAKRPNPAPSNDVLKILSDIKNGGALLHIEQIDKNDIYYHNGGQYR